MIALCHHIKPLLLLVFSIAALSCHAQSDADSRLDSTEISLLTCSPHQEVYSLYGHTAIRVRNAVTGEDLVVNYGVFDFAQPHFVTRFVFGLTDYSMGIMPFSLFYQEYRYYNSSVTQQTLNLTRAEKQNILKALADNAQSPTYRYNYFHDNCTTRARDMLTQHLDGEVHYQGAADSSATFRSMIHDFNEQHPWARFGNDMLLGFGADRRTTRSETQFLPTNLMDDFAIITLTAPLYLPIINSLGFDPLWFGLVFLLNLQMAYLTPPFGFNLFYLKSVVPKEIKLTDIYKSVLPFIALQIIALLICIFVPDIITWLPNKMIA